MTTEKGQQNPVATMFPDLQNSKMLIIGPGGVGKAVLELALQLGVEVSVANRSRPKLDQISAKWPQVETFDVNARDQASVNKLLDTVNPDHIVIATGRPFGLAAGSIDIAAAMDWVGDRLEPLMTIANWIALSDKKPRSFTVVSGFVGLPAMGNLGWSAMGPAIKGLVEHLAVELGPTRVNAVAPGPLMDTSMAFDIVGTEDAVQAMARSLAAQLPIGRAVQSVDAARQVLYVAGDPIATGSIRFTEGGLSLVPSNVIRDAHKGDH